MEILATQLADLFSAVQCSDEKQIRRLLAANVSPIQRNRQGTTALMAATKIGNSKIIQMLHGALRDKRPSAQLFFSQIVSTFSTAVSPTAALTSFMAAAPADSDAISPVPLGAIARPNEAPTLSILPVLPTDLARSNEVSVLPYEKQRTYPADAVAVVVCNSAVCNSAVCNSASAAPLVLREDDELPAFEALALELPAPQLSALSQSTRLSLDQQSEQLKTAVCKNDWGAVKDLLSAGVRVQSKNWYDTPVLVLAAQNASNDIVMALIQAGASVNSGYDRLPLNVASERGDFEVVHMLMRAGAYLEATEENGFTALMCAAAAGHLLIVQTLIACGANVNANYYGKTPLMLAARNGHTKVYDFLYAYMQQDPPEDNRQQQQAMVGAQHSQLDRELYSMFESQIEPEQSR